MSCSLPPSLECKWRPEILSAFAGARFSLVGFASPEAEEMIALLGGMGSLSRSLSIETEPLGEEIADSSAVVLNLLPGPGQARWIEAKRLSPLVPPVLAVGNLDVLIDMFAAQARAWEALSRPWSNDDLVFRLRRCIDRPADRTADRPPSARRKLRILVADDDRSITTLTKAVLEGHGFECHEARDGVQALRLARTLLPDLLVLDINMPIMSGLEVLKALREDLSTSALKVLLITASSRSQEVERGAGLKADGYVCKPFQTFDFLRRVKEIVKEPAAAGAL